MPPVVQQAPDDAGQGSNNPGVPTRCGCSKISSKSGAGIIGLLFNGLFAADYIISLDGVSTNIPGGVIQGNYRQMYVQVGYICAASGYVFVVTALLCKLLDVIPGLGLRATDEGEANGMDEHEIGEFVQDFVEVRRAFDEWTAPSVFSDVKGDREEDIVAAGDRHGGVSLGQPIACYTPQS